MKRLIATIILAIIAMTIAGCDFTYHHVAHRHHGPAPRAIIVTRPPVYWHGPHVRHIPPGHYPHRHWRRH